MTTNFQSGQTLIETIVAVFILTTALTAGLGLAIYAMGVSTTSQNQIVAASLAREGVEVIRVMRDSNWLVSDTNTNPNLQPTNCGDIADKFCYPDAFEQSPPAPGQGFANLAPGNYRVNFNPVNGTWSFQTPIEYNLYLQPDGTYTHDANGNSVFARMINISGNTASPYTNQNSNWELIVKSVVVWRGKNCPSFNPNQDLLAVSSPCKIVVQEHLTNWKDYK